MKSRKTSRTAQAKPANQNRSHRDQNPIGLRIHEIVRAYKHGVDSGHGDLRWFGSDETGFTSRTSERLKPVLGVRVG
jgi:hypothetical protein